MPHNKPYNTPLYNPFYNPPKGIYIAHMRGEGVRIDDGEGGQEESSDALVTDTRKPELSLVEDRV